MGYTSDGISNQEQNTRISWNVDRDLRGYDLARNPGLSSDTEYGAGEFQLPTGPLARAATQSTSKPPSKFRSHSGILKGIRRLLKVIKPSLIASRQYLSGIRRFLIGIS